MRLPRKTKEKAVAAPEDTQEMFAAGGTLPEDPEETREHESLVVEEEFEAEPVEDPLSGDEWEADDEWEEDFDDEPEEEEPEDDTEGPSTSEDLRTWFAAFRARSKAIGSGLFGRIGAIRLPNHEIDGQKVLAVAGILAVTLMVGAAGYVLGKGSGEDVDTARLSGEFAGKKAGAIAGATEGYAAGFKKGRDIAFGKSYAASYKRNYIRAYRNAGMDPPRARDVEVPKP